MKSFEEIINLPVPETLYHYTNSAGFLGIIGSSEVWCTHTQYLNDSREFRHALQLFADEIDQRIAKKSAHTTFLDHLRGICFSGFESVNICVASFSTKKDSLSQWRAYASAPGGVAIGFSGAQLEAAVTKVGGTLHPCVYDEETQRRIVSDVLDYLEEKKDYPAATMVILKVAPILKHSAFASEKEWRVIAGPFAVTEERYSFRPGASMLVPYYKLKIAKQAKELDLKTVIIGPCPNSEQSKQSVKMFLLKFDLTPEIENSAAPFRTW
jgi:hypothetical protein